MGMNNKHWILKLATSLALLMLFQTGHSASLMEIYNLAVANDPQYKAAIANLAAAEEALPQSTANFLPSLGAKASRTESSDANVESIDSYSVTLNQPIYRHGSFVERRTAKSSVSQAESDFSSSGDATTDP